MTAKITNYFCEKFLKRSIGSSSTIGANWHERLYYNVDFNKMHKLYETYLSHNKNKHTKQFKPVGVKTFKRGAQEVDKEPGKSGFIFSKYMGLLFIDTLFGKGGGNLAMCQTKMMRYAQSNLDISTYYIKIS